MFNPIDTDEIRKAWPFPDSMNTHSEECIKWHYTCAIHRLCQQLDEERKKSAAYYNMARDYLINSSDEDPC
jgi:hypothetical protein